VGFYVRWPSIKIVFVSEPFDEIKRVFVHLPVIDQVRFVNAGIFDRYAVNLI